MAEMIFGSTGVWYMIGALLVFFMQCGFAMVETGFTRAKNAGNIIMKKKFGKNAMLKGMNLQEGATARDRNEQIGGHKA